MQYINGGAVEVKRYGFLGLGVKLVVSGNVAELASFVADACVWFGLIF